MLGLGTIECVCVCVCVCVCTDARCAVVLVCARAKYTRYAMSYNGVLTSSLPFLILFWTTRRHAREQYVVALLCVLYINC